MAETENKDEQVGSNEYFKVYTKSNGEKHDIYLSDEIADNSLDYVDLFRFLDYEVKPEDYIHIHLANLGGSTHAGTRLAHSIKRCCATTVISVDAPCYSMGAIIALTGDALLMREGTFLMFHNYSGWHVGKGKEIKDAVSSFQKHMIDSDYYFCYPFLSKSEIKRIHDDKDVYIHSTDKDLTKRLKRHFKKMEFKQ